MFGTLKKIIKKKIQPILLHLVLFYLTYCVCVCSHTTLDNIDKEK